MPAPLRLPAPAASRHALEPDHPSWCDPRRCVNGNIHVGTAKTWYSTIDDLEFGLSRYQADGLPEALLLVLRPIADFSPGRVVSEKDLQRLAAVAAQLRNDDTAGGETTPDPAAGGSGAHAAVTE